jgi:polyhydroxybutyrate depolymerase
LKSLSRAFHDEGGMSEFCKRVRHGSYLAAFLPAQVAVTALLLTCSSCSENATGDDTTTGGASTSSAGASPNGGASSGAGDANALGGTATSTGGTRPDAGAASGSTGTAAGGSDAGGSTTFAGSGGSAGASGASAACNLPRAKGVQQLSLMSSGIARKVRLFVPSKYDGQARLPLVLNLHGSTDNADNFASSSQMEQVAEAEGFAVAGLEAVAGQWNVPPADNLPDDVKYASDAIDLAAATLCIDSARVYASGFSGGGRMSSQLGCELPDKITAIGPVAGVRWPAPCAGRPVPVITIHGLIDTTNAYAGEGPSHPRWNESVEDAVLGWATKNGCSLARQTDDPPGPLSTYSYGQCKQDAAVKLVRMDAVAHAYPTGTPLHAAKEVWGFLKAHSRQ